jgi:hypothetical protein
VATAVAREISGTQEGECPPLEAGTRGLVKGQQTKRLSVCTVNCRQTV